MNSLILGTHNAKKGMELRRQLEPLGFSVQTLEDFPDAIEVVEDGQSFAVELQGPGGQLAFLRAGVDGNESVAANFGQADAAFGAGEF